jgi:four helix bundle protein
MLSVWNKAHAVALAVYKMTEEFPRHELFGITSQMRRASASVAANISEGCGRSGEGEFHRFLSNSMGSALELEYFLILARDLKMVGDKAYTELQRDVLEVQRMLGALIRKVEGARRADRGMPQQATK